MEGSHVKEEGSAPRRTWTRCCEASDLAPGASGGLPTIAARLGALVQASLPAALRGQPAASQSTRRGLRVMR